jgi:flagellin
MRINTNISAMTAQRNLGIASANTAKSIERLSSGLRINRAADDAAGLSISEKLRGQVGGLDQASRNAQDGISLIQTAEGALNESHSILQRMNELAVQGANGTLSSDDRTAVVSELKELKSELDRISSVTDFNGTKLLAGTTPGAAAVPGTDTTAGSVAISTGTGTPANYDSATVSVASGTTTNASYVVKVVGTNGSGQITGVQVSADGGTTFGATQAVTAGATSSVTVATGVTMNFTNAGTVGNVNDGSETFSFSTTGGAAGTPAGKAHTSIDLQIGANSSANERLTVDINAVSSADIGATTSGPASLSAAVTALDVAAPQASDFRNLVDSVQQAVKDVSSVRSNLGAAQNRLEHTIANLGVASENLSASESRIRDLDMASEVVSMTKSQILTQAGTAILAQANQAPQSVLSLLR